MSSDWTSILANGGLESLAYEGEWFTSGYSLRVDDSGSGSWLAACAGDVRDFGFRVGVTVVKSGNVSIFFRQRGMSYYQFDLRHNQQAAIIGKVAGDAANPAIISTAKVSLIAGMSYEVAIEVDGNLITTWVDGNVANQVQDSDLSEGGITLTAWKSRAEFRDPRLRT